jgi:hypothetical protein
MVNLPARNQTNFSEDGKSRNRLLSKKMRLVKLGILNRQPNRQKEQFISLNPREKMLKN